MGVKRLGRWEMLRWACGWLLLAATSAACIEERPDALEEPIEVDGPFVVEGGFGFLQRTFGELVVIRPGFDSLGLFQETRRVHVGRRPLSPVVSPDGQLVLSIDAAEQALTVVEMSDLAVHTIDLPSDYDALTVSPDSRFVVAHFADAAAGGSGESVFRNQNEITVIDLQGGAESGAVRFEQVDSRTLSLRSTPLDFQFAPAFTIRGQTHRVLVVTAVSALTLIDLLATNDDDVQRRLFFVLENSTRALIPRRILFTRDDPGDDRDMRMFVLVSGAEDLFEVSILPDTPAEHALALSLNQFPAGPTPVEMLDFLDAQGDHKLLVLNGAAKQLVVIDVATGNTTDIDIDWSVTQALSYTLIDPETSVERPGALLYEPGSQTVLFVALDEIESRGTRAISALALSRPVQTIGMVAAAGSTKAVVVHSDALALTVLDLERRFALPLPASATLRNIAFSAAGDRVFTTVAERSVLAMIDLENGHPSQVDIPSPGGRLAVLGNPQVVLVDHGDPEGRMTLLDGVDPIEGSSITLEGLFLHNAIERARKGLEGE